MKRINFGKLPEHLVRRMAKELLENPTISFSVPDKAVSDAELVEESRAADTGITYRIPAKRRQSSPPIKPSNSAKPKDAAIEVRKKLEYYDRQFVDDPSRRIVKEAYELSSKHGVWVPVSLVGQYLVSFHGRFKRQWTGTLSGLLDLYNDLKLVHSRVKDEAAEAIEAVFSKDMNWASNKMALLVRADNYERHVLPVVVKLREQNGSRGEQAEWTQERTDEATVEEIKL